MNSLETNRAARAENTAGGADERVVISFFCPQHPSLRREVAVIRTVLICWAVLSFGVPLLVWLSGLGDPTGLGESWLTRNRTLFGFPLHYWLIAQGCTIGFVLLCKLYCTLWDRKVRTTTPVWAEQGAGDE